MSPVRGILDPRPAFRTPSQALSPMPHRYYLNQRLTPGLMRLRRVNGLDNISKNVSQYWPLKKLHFQLPLFGGKPRIIFLMSATLCSNTMKNPTQHCRNFRLYLFNHIGHLYPHTVQAPKLGSVAKLFCRFLSYTSYKTCLLFKITLPCLGCIILFPDLPPRKAKFG